MLVDALKNSNDELLVKYSSLDETCKVSMAENSELKDIVSH